MICGSTLLFLKRFLKNAMNGLSLSEAMLGIGIPAEAIGRQNGIDLLRTCDLKHLLTRIIILRQEIKPKIECLFEQPGKQLPQFPAFGNDLDAIRTETVTKQQYSKAFRQDAAMLLWDAATHLCLCCCGK
jgi:hypothetical protein